MPRRAIYREDGGTYIVDVLQDTTEDGKRTVRFTFVSTKRRSPFHPAFEPGEECTVACVKGYEPYVGWEIEYD